MRILVTLVSLAAALTTTVHESGDRPAMPASTTTAELKCTSPAGSPTVGVVSYVDEGSFTISGPQTVAWTATYYPKVGVAEGSCGWGPGRGRFYLSKVSASGREIVVTETGQTSGTLYLATAGTYHIGIRSTWMGVGKYTVTYNRTASISVSPASHNFGSYAVNGTSAAKTFSIASTGDLPVSQLSVTSSDPARFAVSALSSTTPPSTFTVTYRAGVTPGNYTAAISVQGYNAQATTQPSATASVSGNTYQPTPNIVCHGASELGTANYAENESIDVVRQYRNAGTAALVVTGHDIINETEPNVFAFASTPSTAPLGVGNTRGATISFTPRPELGEQTYEGILVIHSNDADEPVKQCAFTARGHKPAPIMAITQSILDYGSVAVGFERRRVLEVRNVGDAPLEALLQDGWTGNPQFEPHRAQWSDIPLGQAQTVTGPDSEPAHWILTYAPTTTGEHEMRVLVAAGDGSIAPQEVRLTGTGRDPLAARVIMVLDRSAVMAMANPAPSKIENLRLAGLIFLESLIQGQDALGMIKYSNTAQTYLERGPLDAAHYQRALQALAPAAILSASALKPQGVPRPRAAMDAAKAIAESLRGDEVVVWITGMRMSDFERQQLAPTIFPSQPFQPRLPSGTALVVIGIGNDTRRFVQSIAPYTIGAYTVTGSLTAADEAERLRQFYYRLFGRIR